MFLPRRSKLVSATWPLARVSPCWGVQAPLQLALQQQRTPWRGQQRRTFASEPKPKLAYIALGSNLGDRIGAIEAACAAMDATAGIRVRRTSSLWETEPMYVAAQGRFVNGACEIETRLDPLPLLDALQAVERGLGRRKTVDKGPRNIDLDIMLYDGATVRHPRLTVPHAGLLEREFMLRPLAELIANKPLDGSRPWKLIQDHLNDLVPSNPPLSTLTPLSTRACSDTSLDSPPHGAPTLRALNAARRTQLMAILNVTPDSFSDRDLAHALQQSPALAAHTASAYLRAGATVLDVGGQSTRPGAAPVGVDEELARVVPAIRAICALPEMQRHPPHGAVGGASVSVDTSSAAVATAAVEAGASIVNDVSGGSLDAALLPAVARLGCTVVLMHMRGTPGTMDALTDYGDGGVVRGVAQELLARVAAAEAAGVRRWRIVLDPGLGFAKTGAQNCELLARFDELRRWPGLVGLPWVVGPSRKRFIGSVLGRDDGIVPAPADRAWGTAATVAAAVQGGADVVRVHDVNEMAQVAKMADAIWRTTSVK